MPSSSARETRVPLCCFVAEVLKGRWASALLGSFPVGPKTGVNFMLVEDSFANVVIFGQKTTQRRGSNGEVGLHLNHLSPLFHILLRFVFYSNAILNAQSRQLAIAEFA